MFVEFEESNVINRDWITGTLQKTAGCAYFFDDKGVAGLQPTFVFCWEHSIEQFATDGDREEYEFTFFQV